MKLRWTPEAAENLVSICDYVARDSGAAARRIAMAVHEQLSLLLDFPQLGRPGSEKGTRELALIPLPYLVVYRVREDRIEILSIWHGAQKR